MVRWTETNGQKMGRKIRKNNILSFGKLLYIEKIWKDLVRNVSKDWLRLCLNLLVAFLALCFAIEVREVYLDDKKVCV